MTSSPPSGGADLRIAALTAGAAGVWLWSVPEGRLYGDARFADLYGLTHEALAAGVETDRFFASIHPDDRMRIRIAVAGIMHGADLFSKEFRLPTGTGESRWVSANGRAERDAGHRVLTFGGILTDITEQKRLEERLRVAQSAGGVGTFEYVSGFGTVDVSEQFCRLLGLTTTDTLALRAVNATLAPGFPPLIGGGEDAVDGAMDYRECQIIRPDTGERRWIARRGEHRKDGPGGADRFIGAIHDITAFKTAEASLRELTATLEDRVTERTRERDRVWNNSRDLLAVIGPDGGFRATSPSWRRLLGYEPEQLAGHRYRDFIVPEDRLQTDAARARAHEGENLSEFENRFLHRDGGVHWITWNTSAEDGLIYAYGRDITEEKARAAVLAETEDRLRQAQKMEAVGQLTGGLAHDFNNMLTGIIGGLDLVQRRIAEGRLSEIDKFIDGAVKSAHRAAGLTHRLLAFSRQQPLDPQPIGVSALTRSMADLLRRTLGEQVSLEVRADEGLWPAVSDANQLESALLNLAINARDAMPDGGQLTIEASNVVLDASRVAADLDASPGDYVLLSVTDTGEGMPADVVAKAFDPFFTTKPIGQGTGLGLSMIYGFLRQIGGHAEIHSRPGEGTTICLYLPRAAGAAVAPGLTDQTPVPAAGAGETVLVVEDEDSVRLLVVELLDELGYTALAASGAEEALTHLRSDRAIALMITDVGLPGLNGRQLAEMARAQRPRLPVLFVTGYAANAVVRASFLGPGMDMITKPFAMNDLASKIGEMVERSS
ncbi:MAG: PAS domain S-box protein [Caulobacter sp.]|nr:PAS domain S-box protein [Caulobacter sp.]